MNNETQRRTFGLGLDHHADVFASQDSVIRRLRPTHETFYAELVQRPAFRHWITDGYILDTLRAEDANRETILTQKLVKPISFPFEWSTSMFKEVALATLELNLRLMQAGFCTQDGHPWNFVFDGTKPRFVDITSIVPLPQDGRWLGVEEFEAATFNPLVLMEKGYPTTARTLCREIRGYPEKGMVNSVLFDARRRRTRMWPLAYEFRKVEEVVRFFFGKMSGRLTGLHARLFDGTTTGIKKLIRTVENLDVTPPVEDWSCYYATSKDYPTYTGKPEEASMAATATEKHRTVMRILEGLRPATLLDIGCNRGIFCQLAQNYCEKTLGIDTDEFAIAEMYNDTVRNGTGGVPFYVNAFAPAEPIGLAGRRFPAATERFRSDCVLCLAVIHHLVLKSPYLTFDHVTDMLSAYAASHLVVEFVPLDDQYVQEHMLKHHVKVDRFDWYCLANFRASLEKRFARIEQFPSHPSPRSILHCSEPRRQG